MTQVLLTRTQPGADRLASDLRRAGIEVSVKPLLQIEKLKHRLPDKRFDVVVYLSQHAVNCMDSRSVEAEWHLAIGASTQRALSVRNIGSVVSKVGSSEGLLQEITQRVEAASSVLIVCGEGGRDYLVEKLIRLGYAVDELLTYRRRSTQPTMRAGYRPKIIEISSEHALGYLSVLLHSHDCLEWNDFNLVVPSIRIAKACRKSGYSRVHVAKSASARSYLCVIRRLIRDE